jgi:hypothetical protein
MTQVDLKPQHQRASGHRPEPQTAGPLASAQAMHTKEKNTEF